MTTFFKVLREDGWPCHGGVGRWPLPTDNTPGEWTPRLSRIQPCARGYHLCRPQDLVYWLGPAIYVVEYRGELIEDDNKVVVQQARLTRRLTTWNERTARRFAADCAQDAMNKYWTTDDLRPQQAIDAARRFADGEIDTLQLSAARSAAVLAARSAAESAARLAAESAARSAVWSAAGSAVWSAVWSAAGSAVWSAARSAAESAAGLAAESAAREWQTKLLFDYLEEELC